MRVEFPKDAWGTKNGSPIIPRKWQEREIPKLIAHYNKPNPSRAVVYSGTGSGKSILLAQFCACIQTDGNECIVVSTSKQRLVRQIRQTIKDRLESDEFMAEEMVGSYFADSKDTSQKVIVCCNNSMGALADALSKLGRRVCFWIADELHRCQGKVMRAGADKLFYERALGLSATPFLADTRKSIQNFDEVVSRYTIAESLEDKCIVPWEVRNWEGGETSLDEACLEMMMECGDRAVVNAVSISDAVTFSKMACDAGYEIKAVHSRLPDSENEKIIDEFKNRKIKGICHCDLLSEGVDICEISSMTLRRVVSSRNRFIQEVGRGIRAFKDPVTGEEKTRLIINDPHDLFGVLKLGGYVEALSGDGDLDDLDDEESEQSTGKRLERTLQQDCFNVLHHLTQVKAGKIPLDSQPLASYLSQLCSVFDAFGLMDKPLSSRDWRRAPASDKQVKTMQNMKWALGRKQVPSIHKTALELLTHSGAVMNRGIASDLISIEMSLAEKSTWPKFAQLDSAAESGLQRHANRKAGIKRPKPVSAFSAKPHQKLEQGVLFENTSTK